MSLRGLATAVLVLAFSATAFAQVKVRQHGPDKKEEGGVTVREHGPPPKVGIKVNNFVPTTGEVGTKITIAGENFTKQTKVLVGGKPVKLIGFSDKTLLFAFPVRYGDATIVVRHPGAGNDILVGTFNVIAPPAIVTFTPAKGPAGTRVEIRGRGFMKGDQVMFNGKVLAMRELSPHRIIVEIPPDAVSDYFVVARPNGPRAQSAKQFKVELPAPIISSFAPTTGAPGTAVKISGANFDPTDKVFYGRARLTPTAMTSTSIDVVVPQNATTSELFTIKGRRGMVSTTQAFNLVANPSITKFQPLWGPPGTRVELYGQYFRAGDMVMIGEKPVIVRGVEANRMQLEIPQGVTTGLFTIRRGGVVVASAPKPFEVVLAPAISGFSPTSGPVGTRVKIMGANFGPEARVLYGAQTVRVFSNNGTTLEVEIPRNATNQVFTVRTRGGDVSSQTAFQVHTYSVITSVSPLSGPVGTRVWIKGRDFNPTDAFFLGQVSLPIVERGPEGYVVQIPANAQSGHIEWESYGRRQGSRFRFEVLLPPTIASFSPASGPPGTVITVTGTNFTAKTAVFYGSLPCQITRRQLPTTLTAVIPNNASGTDHIWVEESDTRVKSSSTFQVVPPPVISSASPMSGPVGTQVTITGQNLFADASYWLGKVGGTPLTVVKRQVPSLAIVQIPAGATDGHIWVEVRSQSTRSTEVFHVVTLPSATSIAPLQGPIGTQVTIAGASFTASTKVWLGNLACPVVKRTGSTEIVVQIPAGAKGKANFILEDQGEKVNTNIAFTVVEAPPPPPPPDPAAHPDHEHAHEHPHDVGDHHHHPHAHPHRPGKTHHHPY
jgi:hypothetical protein